MTELFLAGAGGSCRRASNGRLCAQHQSAIQHIMFFFYVQCSINFISVFTKTFFFFNISCFGNVWMCSACKITV